ncbi:sirohydrochlorin chelatase [Halobacillus mangrovi]|uniref:Sirohydrochlorin chelatase n=1 Tax=Halobacillus mangrovi TaxID=402384 RepID=A0A1W5ZVT5_9BACI|nr:sirohydrochlorin chelatase [Halobacillus mangrovi]ARI77393.1 sirohydrochlorin chelatase [Halobacillus mangrovi]
MKSVLYVSHGSRVKEARVEAESFLHAVHEQVEVPLWGICFLELAEPSMSEGIKRLVDKGATEITIIPVLLLSAGHYYQDIPEEISDAMKVYPNVKFKYGKPLGVQERINEVLVDRVNELSSSDSKEENILLVGRGSRNPETKQSIQSIASALKKKMNGISVDVCYLAACKPSFEEGLERSLKKDSDTIVVPYLWFTGILIESMKQKISHLQKEGHKVKMTDYLGSHPNMVLAMADRVKEAIASKELTEGLVKS